MPWTRSARAMAGLEEALKARARELGFDLAGITGVDWVQFHTD